MKNKILNYMIQFGSITTWEAFRDLGCTRLSEYIRQIRLDMVVHDEWQECLNRFGEKTHFKKYWID